jgi:predicted O-linked N-acetylglucosamine transferase (SPINDLY family)
MGNADHLAMYGDMDISLDTFPYAGTTTCESLYMGVPCITLAGNCHAHNVGLSLLTTIGLDKGWIAQNESEYIELAVQATGDLPALSQLRKNLRQQMRSCPLCDAEGFVTDLEACYCQLWQRYVHPSKQDAVQTANA